jgi:hypothetical protein
MLVVHLQKAYTKIYKNIKTFITLNILAVKIFYKLKKKKFVILKLSIKKLQAKKTIQNDILMNKMK